MKKIVFILMLINVSVFAQSTFSIQSVGANSVTINYSIDENAILSVYENDTVYYEDFSLFPNTEGSETYNNFLWPLPDSYLRTKGAKGKSIIKPNSSRGLFITKTRGCFRTPTVDISKAYSAGNEEYLCNIFTKTNRQSGTGILSVKDNFSQSIFSITSKNNSSATNLSYTSNNVYFDFSTANNKGDTLLEIVVTIPQEYCNKQPYDILAANTSYTINDLLPNTSYVLQIGEETLSFTTLKEKTLDSIKEITNSSATVYFTNNTSLDKKLKVINKGNTYNFADDLIISQVVENLDYQNALEIYNGTGRDICLKDYTIIGKRTVLMDYEKIFTLRDTIKHNEAIVVYGSFDKFTTPIDNSGTCYVGNNFIAYCPLMLFYGSDTIDIFGGDTTGINSNTGWTCAEFNSRHYVLRRNADINYGVKHNPSSGFPTLCTEWTGDNSTDESNFRDFGLHTLTGTISQSDIANKNLGTPVAESDISLVGGAYQISNLAERTYYVAYLMSEDESIIYGYQGFLTQGTTTRTASGEWTDNNWTNGEPSFNDVVQIDSGVEITVPEGNTAKCNTLILKDGASFKNNGTADIETYNIEQSFSGYNAKTSSSTGWYLWGIPVKVSSDNQTYIAEVLEAREDNDDIDLYFWQEDYTEDESQGMWANYKAYDFAEPFFREGRGYLISYANNTINNFSGTINDNASYTLLNNATLSEEGSYFGWHLVANPYSFPVSLSQIDKNNCTAPSVLNSSGNYVVLTGDNTIKPFEGFFVQVTNSENHLIVNKNAPLAKTSLEDVDLVSFSISSVDGEDNTYLAFDSHFTNALEWQTDNHKLFGYGLAAEIYTSFNGENFSVNVIPPTLEDTLDVDLRCVIKKTGEYTIKYNGVVPSPYNGVALYDRQSGEMINDFTQDSSYTFFADETMNEDMFLLKFFDKSSEIDMLSSSHFINISQKKNILKAYSDEPVRLLTLYSLDGKQILQSSGSIMEVDKKGFFLLKVKTSTNEKVFKIVII